MDTVDKICSAFCDYSTARESEAREAEIREAEAREAEAREARISGSEQVRAQRQKCLELYENLFDELGCEQQKKLLALDFEYFALSDKWLTQGLKEGMNKGFKLAIRLILDAMK